MLPDDHDALLNLHDQNITSQTQPHVNHHYRSITGSFENEALENEDQNTQISKTKHPRSKTKHPKLENEAP